MSQHTAHLVSAKIALFNEARDRVLMTVLPHGGNGLPGGHVEDTEEPDAALVREVKEELGLSTKDYFAVSQRKFWRDQRSNRIILGYIGVLRDGAVITVDPAEVADTVWVSRDELLSGVKGSVTYNEYLLEMMPAP